MNDSLRSEVFVRFTPETIACSCIYLSARVLRIPLPSNPPWYETFGISESDIRDVSRVLLGLYTRVKSDQIKLEKVIDTLKHDFEVSKQKARSASQASQDIVASELAAQDASTSSKSNSPATKDREETAKNGEVPANVVQSDLSKGARHKPSRSRSRSRSRSASVLKSYNQESSPRKSRRSPPKSYVSHRDYTPSPPRKANYREKPKREHQSRSNRNRDYRDGSESPIGRHSNKHDRPDRHHHDSKQSKRPRSRDQRDNRLSKDRRRSRSPLQR